MVSADIELTSSPPESPEDVDVDSVKDVEIVLGMSCISTLPSV